MTRIRWPDTDAPPADRVTAVEVFFDDVRRLCVAHQPRAPRRPSQKLLLFAGMAGFFVAALGIPHAFGATGVLFGLGYVLVICVHLLLFTRSESVEGVLRLAPYNLGGGLLILAAGFTRGAAEYALWIAGFLLMTTVPYLVPRYSWISAARALQAPMTNALLGFKGWKGSKGIGSSRQWARSRRIEQSGDPF